MSALIQNNLQQWDMVNLLESTAGAVISVSNSFLVMDKLSLVVNDYQTPVDTGEKLFQCTQVQ